MSSAEILYGLPDYTDYDFSRTPLYKSKPHSPVEARQLTGGYTIARSWGEQILRAGDWVVLKPSLDDSVKESGVGAFAFNATYVCVGAGRYMRQKYIRAAKMDHAYQFTNPDNPGKLSRAPADTYLVLNMSKDRVPLEKDGVRDILYYTQQDIDSNYDLIQE